MEVQRISDTVQKFNGESYYKCGFYFQRKGRRLHREVWMYHNGEIPTGYDIHHKDGDRSNNSIENLEMLPEYEHMSLHMSTPERVAQSRENIKKAIAAAPKWHSSPEGKAWHSQHGKKVAAHQKEIAVPKTFVCAWCGKEFQSTYDSPKLKNRYCCSNHKTYAAMKRAYHENKKHQES